MEIIILPGRGAGKSTVLEKDWLRGLATFNGRNLDLFFAEFAGYLHRRSRSRKKIWLRRYFVFKNDVLRYFVDSRELEFHWEAKVETITKVFRNSEGYVSAILKLAAGFRKLIRSVGQVAIYDNDTSERCGAGVGVQG